MKVSNYKSPSYHRSCDYDWLNSVAKNSLLSAKDVAQIFKISTSGLSYKVENGQFKKHDLEVRKGGNRRNKLCWYASTVLSEIKRVELEFNLANNEA